MFRYRIMYATARALTALAMAVDSPRLFEIGGSIELYADECRG